MNICLDIETDRDTTMVDWLKTVAAGLCMVVGVGGLILSAVLFLLLWLLGVIV